jgi:hypothetical protein
MKPTNSIAFATWMLEHLTFGSPNEALSGDLLEELQSGSSARWYWRQVLSAIAVAAFSKSRAYSLPLLFSAGWSLLYPVWWLSIAANRLTQAFFTQWSAHDWPYSTALNGVGQTIPAITFVWLGLFIYLSLGNEHSRVPSRLRLIASLSISLNVLILASIGLWLPLNRAKAQVSYVAGREFFFSSHLIAISIPLALSLFSAISVALSRSQERRSVHLL